MYLYLYIYIYIGPVYCDNIYNGPIRMCPPFALNATQYEWIHFVSCPVQTEGIFPHVGKYLNFKQLLLECGFPIQNNIGSPVVSSCPI